MPLSPLSDIRLLGFNYYLSIYKLLGFFNVWNCLIYELFNHLWMLWENMVRLDVCLWRLCFVRFLSSAFSNISFETLIILSDSKILKWMKMKNRKKENDKRRRREKRIEPVQSSNIEFEHLIPVTNMSNLSFEEWQ